MSAPDQQPATTQPPRGHHPTQPGGPPPTATFWTPQPGYWPAPIVQPPPPTPPQKGGFARGLGIGTGVGLGFGGVIAIGMLVSSLIFGLLVGAAASVGSDPTFSMRTVWGADTAPNKIHAIYVTGTILADPADGATLGGGTYGYEIADQIDALDASDAAGLLLIMNTPGGSINGSKAMADAVARYQERTGKKVVAHVQGLSASGGMYTMAGADEIIADYGSLIGSIGVIFGPFERYKDVKAITGTLFTPGIETSGGIEQTYLTMGKDKDMGNPFRDMREEERESLMTGITNAYNEFVDTVATGRNLPREKIINELGAHIFDPKTAIANGLIDSQLGIEEAYRQAATVMGVDPDKTKIVTPAAPGLLEQLLGVAARVPGHAPELASDTVPAASICGTTPRVLVYHGNPLGVCR